MYHSSQIGPAPFTNAAGYRNQRVDALFDRAEPDRGARTLGASSTVRSRRSLVQELPYVWLVETPTTRAWSARCGGFKAWTGLFAEEASCKR